MPIAPLSPSTISNLHSHRVLPTPLAIATELVANALDAYARHITLAISPNGLDVLEVCDDGTGVAPVDRPLIGKPSCTSKIVTVEDVGRLGSTLGWRGGALAALILGAETVRMVSRIDGETVAWVGEWKRGARGSDTLTSHPFGTLVRATNLLYQIPVRRQKFLGKSTKIIEEIKEMLRSYAFARPQIRWTLKVLGGRETKSDWSYVPSKGETIMEVAKALIGKTVAEDFEIGEWPTPANGNDQPSAPREQIRVMALLPKPGRDTGKTTGHGQYISIDSRPLTSSKGVAKQLIKLIKPYLMAWTSSKVKDPFLCIQLFCPPNSYDPNIEPGKDDVLFSDIEAVLSIFERFLSSFYRDHQQTLSLSTLSEQGGGEFQPADGSAIYGGGDGDFPEQSLISSSEENPSEDDVHDIRYSNPWIMAKLNGRAKQRAQTSFQTPPNSDPYSQTPKQGKRSGLKDWKNAARSEHPDSAQHEDMFEHTAGSYQGPISPSSSVQAESRSSSELPSELEMARGTPGGVPLTDIPHINQQRPFGEKRLRKETAPSHSESPARSSFQGAHDAPQAYTLSDSRGSRHRLTNPGDSITDDEMIISGRHSKPRSPQNQRDLDAIMDFEHRKQRAAQEHRKKEHQSIRGSENGRVSHTFASSNSHTSPHRNRYESALVALQPSPSVPTIQSLSLPATDSRALLIRLQAEEEASTHEPCSTVSFLISEKEKRKRHRRSLAHLPLESVPQGHGVGELSTTIATSLGALQTSALAMMLNDEYICLGKLGYAFRDEQAMARWRVVLREILERRGQSTEGVLNGFEEAIRKHVDGHAEDELDVRFEDHSRTISRTISRTV